VRQRDQAPHEVRSPTGHPHVGQDEGSAVLADGRDRVVAGGGVTHDAEVALLLEEPGQRGTDAVVVVRDDDGDLTADRSRHRSTLAHGAPSCPDAAAPLG
jgi:hypothetical protein